MKTLKIHFLNYSTYYALFFLIATSTTAFVYFEGRDQLLLYGDSLSRMNISRKIFDNLNPGLAQVGNVWLPLPQLLMLPLVYSDTLWHTGIAGSIMSMSMFIIGGVFLYATLNQLNTSKFWNFIALSLYTFNPNILYLQVTAMSEAIYLCFVSALIYFFVRWVKTQNRMFLLPAAACLSAMSLIRYEALSMLFASILMVFVITIIHEKKYAKAEGNLVLFSSFAATGFFLWTLHLWTIFGDPFFWINYYVEEHVVGDATTQLHIIKDELPAVEALLKYLTTTVWMNGLISVLLAFVGTFSLLFKSIKEKSVEFMPVLLSSAMFLFMILTLQRNTPIDQPQLNLQAILSNETSQFKEFNIRYGLLMLPMITLLAGYAFNTKNKLSKAVLTIALLFQIYTYTNPFITLIYQIPISIGDNITQGTLKEKQTTAWLKSNYDGGKIMISALKHDAQMLVLGVNYKTYIHEGAGKYWIEATKDPQRYARWVVFDSYNKDDQVTKYLLGSKNLELFYNLEYENDGMQVYKIKTQPDIIL